jgi:hypothetical protein
MTRRVLSSDTVGSDAPVTHRTRPRTLGWMSILLASFVLPLVYAVAPVSAATGAQPQPVVEEPGVSGYVLAPDGTAVSGGMVVAQSGFVSTTGSIDRTGRFRLIPARSGLHPGGRARPGAVSRHRGRAGVEISAAAGNASMDNFLDTESDRRFEPPGRLSLGPLPSGTYVIELHGAGGLRKERIRIVARDVDATFR